MKGGRRTAGPLPPLPDGARGEAVARRLKAVPKASKRAYLVAVAGRSRKAGIRAMCMECVGFDRTAVRECSALACALWAYRPFQP